MTGAETPCISVNFFSGGCHTPPSLGWEVSAHMSSQSNDGLRVHNVKMKKLQLGQKRGAFRCIYGLQSPSINRFEFFHHQTPGLAGSSCCKDFSAKMN